MYKLQEDVEENYPRRISTYERHLARLESDLSLYNKNKENNTLILNDKKYTDLVEADREMKKYIKDKAINQPTTIGEYKGFKISIQQNTMSGIYSAVLINNEAYEVRLSLSKKEVNNIERIEQKLQKIKQIHNKTQEELNSVKNTLYNLKEKLNTPFEKEVELKELLKRQVELNNIFDKDKSELER